MARKMKAVENAISEIKYTDKAGKYTYSPQQQTILNKYSNFPKQYKKLFKDAEVRTVTDFKGNT